MSIQKYLERILRIDDLIRRRATGSPKELAAKLGVSERLVYDYLNIIRRYDAIIKYSYEFNSYFYVNDGYFEIGFKEY